LGIREAGQGARRITELLTQPQWPATVRGDPHLSQAVFLLALGRGNAASRELEHAARIVPGKALELQALWAGADLLPWEASRLRSLRESVERRSDAREGEAPPGFHPEIQRELAHYLAGRLLVREENLDGARRHALHLRELRRGPRAHPLPSGYMRLLDVLDAGLNAAILKAEELPAEADAEMPEPRCS
jgi:hypothetical protein